MVFCDNCGYELRSTAKFCGKCGTQIVTSDVGTTPSPNYGTADEIQNKRQNQSDLPEYNKGMFATAKPAGRIWYLLPILFGLLGGILAWVIIRNRNPKRARNILILGIIPFAFYFGLFMLTAGLSDDFESGDGINFDSGDGINFGFGGETGSNVLQIGVTDSRGPMMVAVDKIEFSSNKAKIFLTVENTGNKDVHFYEGQSYVRQGNKQFQYKYCSNTIDGYDIPSGIIRDGVICTDVWDTNKEAELVLYGMYWKGGTFGDWIDANLSFYLEPEQPT